MEDPRAKPSLADDPTFLASLSDLDRGLTGDAPATSPPPAPLTSPRNTAHSSGPAAAAPAVLPPRARGPRRVPLPPSIISPFDALTMNDPPLPPVAVPKVEIPDQPTVLRPLIDLFPPETPHEKREAPAHSTAEDKATCESFYGFNEKPFALTTDPLFFFHSTPHDAVGQRLLTAVRKREGLVVLTGEIGTGKTMVCRTVIEQLDRRTLTSFVADPFVTAEDLLKTILVDFGVASHAELARGDATRHELSTTVLSFVESLASLEATAIVIIDEAQNLPPDVMDQIRILAEAGEASSLLQVVLVGQPGLSALLRRREYATLQQRVTVRAALAPLPADEVDGYVMHRLAVAGNAPRVHFDQAAIERIYRLSQGVPRMINLLADRALARGFEASASVIDARLIDGAAEDLDLAEPRSRAHGIASRAAAVAALLACALAGAAVAALVFRDAFNRALAYWRP